MVKTPKEQRAARQSRLRSSTARNTRTAEPLPMVCRSGRPCRHDPRLGDAAKHRPSELISRKMSRISLKDPAINPGHLSQLRLS